MNIPQNHKKILDNEISKIMSNKDLSTLNLSKEVIGESISYIANNLYFNPWILQETMFKELKISKKEDLIQINKIIYLNNNIQNLIKKLSPARKYWNTILPFMNKVEKVLNNEYSSPLRIALFPGLSCMFFCGFCGRNQKAKYPSNSVDQSVKNIKEILNKKNSSTKISISGGLEPLTNTRINDILAHESINDIKIPLITNGYNLTENFINKNPNLFNLDSIRVSLYGFDEQSYFNITRNKKSFQMIKQNVVNLLKKRNEINKNLKIGMNFIILRENMNFLNKVIDFIKSINESVSNGNGVDFLSLRDDYHSVTGNNNKFDTDRIYRTEQRIENEDRKKLMHILKEFDDYKKKHCNGLHIDYGYSLEFLSKGFYDVGLKKVKSTELNEKGFTQLSVAVDTYGDVFMFREAGFLNREGNKKMIIGRVGDNMNLEKVIRNFLSNPNHKTFDDNDLRFLDSFDHVLAAMVSQKKKDKKFGINLNQSPIKDEKYDQANGIGNNWYSDAI